MGRLGLVFFLLLVGLQAQTWKTTRTYRGTGVPAAGRCSNGFDVGIVYTNEAAGGQVYSCLRAAGGTYTWTPVGTGGVAASLSAQYINWNATSGGASIANKPTIGTAANNLVQLNASAQLPAVSAALLTDLPVSPVCSKYTVAYTTLTDADTSQDVTLFELPARGKLTGITIKHSTAFAAESLSALTVQLGWSGDATYYSMPFSVFQAVADTTFQDDGGQVSASHAAHNVVARFTSTGANLNTLSAGAVDVWVCRVTLP